MSDETLQSQTCSGLKYFLFKNIFSLKIFLTSTVSVEGPRILVFSLPSLRSCRALTLPSLPLTVSLTLLTSPPGVLSWQR